MADPIELYYWPTPNGWKVSIFLEETATPYTLKPVNIGKGEQFEPDFLKISPNNRMPAIIDPDGPDGKPVSVFESGAILQYLGRKTGQFYPADERARVEVEQWLFWQMGGLGPMAGQAHHFRNYAPEKIEYGINRYTDEVHRLYGVLDTRLKDRDYVAGDYSIADMAIWPWYGQLQQGKLYEAGEFLDVESYTNVARWTAAIDARPAVKRGKKVNRLTGHPAGQLHERHDASDFELRTQDKIGEPEKG